ncbi:MAG: hypothetical protein QOD84_1928 [Acidobacteriaceae bacterium]|jgi:hypothetical protein
MGLSHLQRFPAVRRGKNIVVVSYREEINLLFPGNVYMGCEG